jgi:hypothetical protein
MSTKKAQQKKKVDAEIEIKQKIKSLLNNQPKDDEGDKDDDDEGTVDSQFDNLMDQLVAIRLSSGDDKTGGVYGIHITDLNARKSIPFTVTGRRLIQPKKQGEVEHFHLIKFGKANDYKERFSQFSFKYDVLFQFDGPTTAEKTLSNIMPCNFYEGFFSDDYEDGTAAGRNSAKKWLCLTGSPGLGDWRVISASALDRLKTMSPKINAANYRELFENLCKSKVRVEDLKLEFTVTGKNTKFAESMLVVV